jgi:hypothetical protein
MYIKNSAVVANTKAWAFLVSRQIFKFDDYPKIK